MTNRIKSRKWSPAEDDIILKEYPIKGSSLDIPNRTQAAIQRRAQILKVSRLKCWTSEEDEEMKKLYPELGPRKMMQRLNRSYGAIQTRARFWNLECKVRNDGSRIWTKEEIDLVQSRYPTEGAVKLAVELGRTRLSISGCAHQLGLTVDRSRYRMFSEGRLGKDAKTFRGHGRVFGSYMSRIRKGAEQRGFSCEVDAQYLDSITIDVCPLSGLPIIYPRYTDDEEATASLDRIDSSKGYIKGNVQWVHKDVNMMKNDMSERQLFEYARAIYSTLSKRYS